MARGYESEDSPTERRSRYDRKTSSRSNNRRNDSSDSDQGRRETVREKRDESVRVRDRRGKVDVYSDSDREDDRKRGGEEKSRNQHLEKEASGRVRVELQERKRDDSPRNSNDKDSDVERKQRRRHDKEDEDLVSERGKRDRRHRRDHRRGEVGHDSDSDREDGSKGVGEKRKGSEREKSRNRHLEEEPSERVRVELQEGKRDDIPRNSDDEDDDVERKQSRRPDKEAGELVLERRDRDRTHGSDHRRGKVHHDSDSGREDDRDRKRVGEKKGSEREKSRNRHLEEGANDRAKVELEEHKREESPKVSDEEHSDVERKRKRHYDKEDGELVSERGRRDRRHRSDHRGRKHDRESSEEDERSRRGKERNGKSRNDERGRDNGESHRRMDRRRSPRIHGRHREEVGRHGKEEHRESKDKESHMKVDQDAKAQKQPTEMESNPAGNVATLGRTGGVYIPPFKLARMMKEVEDKSSAEYQRLTWDALRKSINGLVNKVNGTNIKNIIPELLGENLIRGRGLFCRAVMKSQFASPGFTHVFAALVAVVNTKFPQIGDLLLRRIILQLRRAYKRNDKPQLLAAVKFVAHLVNQQVAHELIALELLTILLDQPTDDSVEVAVGFVTDCGAILQDLSPKGLHGIFERFRGILHEGEIDKRVQFLIEGLFAIRKAKFQGHPAIRPELDLVEPEDQLTHEISIIDEEVDQEISLDIFKPDPDYLENEKRYEELKKSILGEESEEEDGSDEGSGSDDDDDSDDEEMDEEERMEIQDQTETNLVNLRRTIYLTIMSSVDFEEAGHKLLKIKLEPGQEMELCIMLLECCSQERTYLRYYGLLGQRFCMLNRIHQENFETCFMQQYSMIHRLETNKLRNVAKFFAHLLGTFALPWHVLSYIRLTEEDTTSSSRIFIKILFQELAEHLGIHLLDERLNDPTMQDSFESIFPKDNPRNTRFAINFFTSIGLGGITENLREYLKNMPRMIMQQQKEVSEEESESGSGSDSGSDSESEKSDSSSDREKRKKRRR